MGHYYTLGSELPDLKLEQSSLVYSSLELWETMQSVLSSKDKEQMRLLFLEEDNRILMKILKGFDLEQSSVPVNLGIEKLKDLVSFFKENEFEPEEAENYEEVTEGVPTYILNFVKAFLAGEYEDHDQFAEDILAVAYYNYLKKKASGFLKDWFDLNRMVANVLAAQTAKKFDLDVNDFLLGDTPLVDVLKQNAMNDVNTLPNSDEVERVVKIAEEPNLFRKEKLLDEFRWEYLEEKTFADPFSMKAMMSYFLKTRLIERWTMLDREQGEAAFREMIKSLNKDGKDQLASFVEKTKK